MNSAQLRQSFLDFFAGKEHAIVPSAPLLPSAPNLLFTNAGMNPFVPYFLGEREAPYARAADTQKCIRAGGKHNDLDDVGFDTYHHTFFEMLGNWSFGDYFKAEAIQWAWELLTQVWGLPKERLYATVYTPQAGDPSDFDQEAHDHWKAIFQREGLDPDVHIVNGGKKDNFWMMGETGPCGPCSEIHIDLTEHGDTGGKLVNADSERCMEIWNLVFIQFNATPEGEFVPLRHKHVDTGMGFERVAGIMATSRNFTDFAEAPSNYNADLFTDLFDKLTELCGQTYGRTLPAARDRLSPEELRDCAFRILADHARALCFSIADGILPGNEGRNYVLRRILRRACLWARRLELPSGSFSQLAPVVIEKFGSVFPELRQQQAVVEKVIQNEEASFDRTLDTGIRRFNTLVESLPGTTIPGNDAFELYDTYGFPLDLIEILAHERSLEIDLVGFHEQMTAQQERARAHQKKSVIRVAGTETDVQATRFEGFGPSGLTDFPATLLEIHLTEEKRGFVVTDATPFYAQMGGQVGDTGIVGGPQKAFRVINTTKDDAGRYLHELDLSDLAENEAPPDHLPENAPVALSIDLPRRRAIQRHHSATHILNYALREVLGSHIRQAGSLVTDERLRFDFAHFEAIAPEQLREIETIVNARIRENGAVQWYEIPYNEKPDDVVAVFGEKYGDVVRVVDIGGYSKELCGGTHVQAAGEIGLCQIVAETAIAAGTRRIEAVCGESAYRLAQANFDTLQSLAQRLSCKVEEVEMRIDRLLSERVRLEKELKSQRQQGAAAQADELVAGALEKDGLKWVAAQVDVESPGDLRGLGSSVSKKLGPSVVVLGDAFDDKATVVALCSPEAIAAGHKAGDIIRELAGQLGGKGGGKPDFAMGGGKEPAKIEAVLKAFLTT
ncbi:MAG: alanine--tRNA ligase [Opitutales bacterium]